METNWKEIEKQIKRTHHFAWSPKHIETTKTDLKPRLAIHLVEQTFEQLGWELVHLAQNEAEAYYLDGFGFRREKVSIQVRTYGEVEVKSESSGNEMWDLGRNSKRVRLFIHAFQQLAEQQDANSLQALKTAVEEKDSWANYEEPESFPTPPDQTESNSVWAVALGVLAAIVLSAIWARFTVQGMYIILLYEFLIALALAKTLAFGFRKGNFTHFVGVQWILAGCTMLVAGLYQYFQYLFVVGSGELLALSLWDLLNERFSQGLLIEGINLGAPGLMILLAVQPVLIYLIALAFVSKSHIRLLIDRVPMEVVDYTYFQIMQGKNETQVRSELSKKGWKDKGLQDMVFEAMGAISEAMELNRG